MNTRGNNGGRVGEVADWGNKAPLQAPIAGVQVHFNPAALTDGEVREALVQMSQAITVQVHTIIA